MIASAASRPESFGHRLLRVIAWELWPASSWLCMRVHRFADLRAGMGPTYSRFWYGISEGSWTVVCGHSLLAGAKMCVWIWRRCPEGGP